MNKTDKVLEEAIQMTETENNEVSDLRKSQADKIIRQMRKETRRSRTIIKPNIKKATEKQRKKRNAQRHNE